jgi:hypothetical protein
MSMKYLPRIAAASVLAVAAAWAAPQVHPPPVTQPKSVTKSLQGETPPELAQAMRQLYGAITEARAKNGPDKIDVAALDQKLRELARGYSAHGLSSREMEDHVVDITHQLLEIGKKDPKIFDSFENFAVALHGPN